MKIYFPAAVNPQLAPVMPIVERNGQLVVDGRRVIDVTASLRPGAGGQPFYNWQATKATLKERFQYLFNNELQADIHFIVGRGVSSQRIPAHRVSDSDNTQIWIINNIN